jgi:hypothetical protein
VGVGGGASREEGGFAVLDWRLALHDLVDPPGGFSPATQLEFLKTRLRWDARGAGGRLRLDEALLVGAAAMTPLDRLDPRVSWKLSAGASRVRDAGCRECIAADLAAGGGATLVAGPLALMLTADVELQAAPDLRGAGGSAFRPGVGPAAALRLLGGERAALLASASWHWLPGASPGRTWELAAVARLHLGPASLFAEGKRTPSDAEVLAGVYLFY